MRDILTKVMISVFLFAPIYATALDVAKDEITEGIDTSISFINYQGTHKETDSFEEIYEIGSILGNKMSENAGTGSYFNKYTFIHAVGPKDETGFDADILILSNQARVDHIRNLRLIIRAYLETAYGYERDTADSLAKFITFYNAQYRNDIDFFTKRYKPTVHKHLSKEKAGLSLRYNEWPGNTQVVIPLIQTTDGEPGGPSASELSDKRVIESAREDDDKGVEDRKNMVELRERQLEEKKKDTEEQEQKIEEEEKQLQEEESEIQQEQEETQEQIEKLEQQKQQLEDEEQTTETEEERQQIEQQQKEISRERQEAEEKQKELSQQQQEVEDKQKELAEEKQEVSESKQQIEEEQQDIQQERESIAEDQKSVFEKEESTGTTGKDVVFYKVSKQSGIYKGIFYLVDRNTGTAFRNTKGKTIYGRAYIINNSTIIAKTEKSGSNGNIVLSGISAKSLEETKTSQVNIYIDSMLIQYNDSVYAVIEREGRYTLGMFNNQLELKNETSESIAPYTMIRQEKTEIIVQSEGGDMLIYDSELNLQKRME